MSRKKLIMTVDDDESIRVTLRLVLEMAGYDVIEAAEGKEALAKLHAAQDALPVVILTDWNMPNGMGGEAFLDAVKRDAALAGIPLIVVSGTADRSAALRMGAERVINKPFDLNTLLVAVESVCAAIEAPRCFASLSLAMGGEYG